MSEEMKMSDYFSGEFKSAIISAKATYAVSGIGQIASELGESHCAAVTHAANNHDRLTEENRKLREFATYINSLTNCDETKKSMELHSLTLKAKQLLEELK